MHDKEDEQIFQHQNYDAYNSVSPGELRLGLDKIYSSPEVEMHKVEQYWSLKDIISLTPDQLQKKIFKMSKNQFV